METLEKVNSDVKKYTIDTNESIVHWHGKKVLGQHNGTVKVSAGEILLSNNEVVGGNVKVDISTLESHDLKSDPDTKKMLEGHLLSDDFFNAEKYPDITFKINSVAPSKDGKAAHVVIGDLTIRDVTKSVSFPANIITGEENITAEIDADIDRTDFGLKYGSGKFFAGLGDNLISDKFNVKIKVVAKK